MVVSPSHQRLIDITRPLLRIGDSVISPSASVRNLSFTLDAQMTMLQRVTNVVRSGNVHLRSIGRVRRYLNAPTAAAAARRNIHSVTAGLSQRSNCWPFQQTHKQVSGCPEQRCRPVTRTSLQDLTLHLSFRSYIGCLFDCVFFTMLCVCLIRRTILQPQHI